SNAFQHTWCAQSPDHFFGNNEWLWADSAYACHKWCVVPFKKPTEGSLNQDQKTFNYHLSTICVHTKHFYGSLKGHFQSLQELRVQIQSLKDLQYVNMWVRFCLILHNMIVEIEENLG
ncbi:hypothetical protein BS17DRAFT_669049, partial [Gyrodon lividus]